MVNKVKKIGLVGGTGPESTLMYYKELNDRIDDASENSEMPEIAIESVNFRKVWGMVERSEYNELSDHLTDLINNLKASGAEVISLTAVTMHIVFDEIRKKTGCDLIGIPEAVSEYALSKGYKKVGLLGTVFTMEKDYMKKPFLDSGIGVYVPNEEEKALIGKRILEELEKGIVKESTLKEFQDIIGRMRKDHGIEAVILGCTELPLLLNRDNCPVDVLDSVEIHINKLIEEAVV